GLTIELAGAYAIAAAAEKSIRGDMIRSIALSILMLQTLFLLVYRDPFSFVRAVLPVVAGIVAAFGLYSMFSLRLTPITAVIGGVLAGIGIDYCIHFLSHHAGLLSSGRSRFDAIAGSLAEVGPAMTAACGTSVLGFLAISRSNVQALRDFAWLGATGLAGALLAAFVLLPVLLTLRREGAKSRHLRPLRIDIEPFVRRVCVHRKGSFIGALALMAIAVGVLSFGSGRSSWFEDDLTVMHPRPNAPLAAQRRIAERFDVSPEAMIVLLESDGPDGLVSLSHRVASRLAGEGPRRAGVAGTYGLADLLPDPDGIPARRTMIEALDADRILQDFDAALQRSIFDPAAYEAYAAFLRRLLSESAPPGIAALGEYPGLAETFLPTPRPDSVGGAHGAAALTYVHLAHPPETREHRDAVIRAIRQALGDVDGATLTGLSVIAGDTEHGIRRELSRLLGVAAGAVAIWLLLFFRSIRAAALALLPAGFGVLCLFAVMRITGTKLNMINLIALPLLVGIGVDDGIFLVSIARARRRDGGDVAQGLSAACHAVMMTSVTTTLTFGTLAFTSTPAIQSLGRIMAVGVTASFAGAVFLLVPILSRGAVRK
ncbi:MAG: MMPL family transporter, partial [Planctomycetes bacterium]|nr:MMPL family transporter [Planctomycetota bacterium]